MRFALLVLAALILILEFFVVSFGLLSVVSIACVAGAIYFAFLAGEVVGWTFTVVTPVLGDIDSPMGGATYTHVETTCPTS